MRKSVFTKPPLWRSLWPQMGFPVQTQGKGSNLKSLVRISFPSEYTCRLKFHFNLFWKKCHHHRRVIYLPFRVLASIAVHVVEVALPQGCFTQQTPSDINIPTNTKRKAGNSLCHCFELAWFIINNTGRLWLTTSPFIYEQWELFSCMDSSLSE